MSTPNARRRALQRIIEQRPSKPLREGDHMLLTHALRCRCEVCNRLIREWREDGFLLVGDCLGCKRRYTLQPHSVMVKIEDLHDTRILRNAEGSEFPDTEADLKLEG